MEQTKFRFTSSESYSSALKELNSVSRRAEDERRRLLDIESEMKKISNSLQKISDLTDFGADCLFINIKKTAPDCSTIYKIPVSALCAAFQEECKEVEIDIS